MASIIRRARGRGRRGFGEIEMDAVQGHRRSGGRRDGAGVDLGGLVRRRDVWKGVLRWLIGRLLGSRSRKRCENRETYGVCIPDARVCVPGGRGEVLLQSAVLGGIYSCWGGRPSEAVATVAAPRRER